MKFLIPIFELSWTALRKKPEAFQCILCVLHFVPNGLKLRGHLGSELQRKAATILSIEKMCIRDRDNDGKIVIPEHDYVHIPSICKVFRYKFEHALMELFDAGRLEHDFRDRREFMGFIKKVANKKDWIVHL